MKKIALLIMLMITSTSLWAEGLIVIAKPLSAKLSDKPCSDYVDNDSDSLFQEICMDRVFNVSYKILKVVSGNYREEVIEAIDFYHYRGLPDHMIIDPACVNFVIEKGEYVHLEAVPATKTKEGYGCADFNKE